MNSLDRMAWNQAREDPTAFSQYVASVRASSRLLALEEAASVAEAYEPHCESCPRGVVNAIRGLKRKPKAA